MNKQELLAEVLNLKGYNFLLELPTGTGKSRLALEKVKQSCISGNLLIVVNRIVHKANWREEIHKWWKYCPLNITFITYASIHKVSRNVFYDWVIFDEAHHLSERCREAARTIKIGKSILLSATISRALRQGLRYLFPDLVEYRKTLRSVIEDGNLPDPMVYLFPVDLDNANYTEVIFKNLKAQGSVIECTWGNRWKYIKQKNNPVRVFCTERQYMQDMEGLIDFWKRKYMGTKSEVYKNKWLKLCGDRLIWLSNHKIPYVLEILKKLNKYRTLTFCNSIEQTEKLGKYCINSKNKQSIEYLEAFNNKKINHITSCNILNEGMNLTDCQIGIFNNLNSSNMITIQRIGRLLRHEKPVLIIPFFKDTRESDLVDKMLVNYNSELIRTINDVDEINI